MWVVHVGGTALLQQPILSYRTGSSWSLKLNMMYLIMHYKWFGILYNISNSVCHPLGRDKLFIKVITCPEWDFKVIIRCNIVELVLIMMLLLLLLLMLLMLLTVDQWERLIWYQIILLEQSKVIGQNNFEAEKCSC